MPQVLSRPGTQTARTQVDERRRHAYTESEPIDLISTMSVTTPTKKEIVVPQHIRRKAGIKAGEPVEFTASAGTITIKPRKVDPDDVLTPAEAALVRKGEREIKQGKYITLEQLRHGLDRPRSRRRTKTA